MLRLGFLTRKVALRLSELLAREEALHWRLLRNAELEAETDRKRRATQHFQGEEPSRRGARANEPLPNKFVLSCSPRNMYMYVCALVGANKVPRGSYSHEIRGEPFRRRQRKRHAKSAAILKVKTTQRAPFWSSGNKFQTKRRKMERRKSGEEASSPQFVRPENGN